MRVQSCEEMRVVIISTSTTSRPGTSWSCGFLWPIFPFVEKEIQGYLETGQTETRLHGDKPCVNYQILGDLYDADTWDLRPITVSDRRGKRYPCGVLVHANNNADYVLSNQSVWEAVGKKYTVKLDPMNGMYCAYEVLSVSNEKVETRWAGFYKTEQEALSALEKASTQLFRREQQVQVRRVDYRTTNKLLPWGGTLKESDMMRHLSILSYGDPQPYTAGDLCMEAVQGTRAIDINTLMYCKELLEFGQMVLSTWQSVKGLNPKQLKKALSSASSLYLSYHYGYRLSWKDTQTLVQAAARELQGVKRDFAATRARHEYSWDYSFGSLINLTCKSQVTAKVWYNQCDSTILRTLNQLFRWDIFPELGNVYDMIPYSFVVDWFLPFGDILAKIDNHTYSYTLNVQSVVYSKTYTVEGVPADAALLRGLISGYTSPGLTLKYYKRWWEPELSYPRLELKLQAGPKNWIPAGALILQRLR